MTSMFMFIEQNIIELLLVMYLGVVPGVNTQYPCVQTLLWETGCIVIIWLLRGCFRVDVVANIWGGNFCLEQIFNSISKQKKKNHYEFLSPCWFIIDLIRLFAFWKYLCCISNACKQQWQIRPILRGLS